MSLSHDAQQEIIAELAGRPGHEKIRVLLHQLLTDGLGARSRDISYEKQTRTLDVRGRIDALLGRTVIELKSDLRDEVYAAQLAGYLKERRESTGREYIGVVTDGAVFLAHELGSGDELLPLGEHVPDFEHPDRTLRWLESVVALQDRLPPDVPRIQLELGRESVLYRRAFRELRQLAERLADHPEVVLKRQLWDRLLRVAYGTEIDAPDLFLQHTYLVILAKAVATAALTQGIPDSGRDLLDGRPFRDLGILNAVEADFFDWVLSDPAGDDLVLRIARQGQRFDLAEIDIDVLKGLYESLIDPSQRHDLGEYYTPDWLAARVCAATIERPTEQRVIDPACGSGTFLFHALRRLVAAADTAGMEASEIVTLAGEKVAGIDVHPVAVIFARATWLLALAPTFGRGRPPAVSVPVYLGDALQWNTRELMSKSELEILVPAGKRGEPAAVLRFPEDVIDQPQLFDRILDAMLRLAQDGQPSRTMVDWLRENEVAGDPKMLAETYDKLVALNEQGRNHIWGYVARNLSRPIWLATERQKADVVVGNPPWVRYSALSRANQERLKAEATRANVWVGGKSATASDLSAYFFARAVDLYMKRDGAIAFVLPYAAMSRDPYAKFRKGDFHRGASTVSVRFTAAWTFPSDVQPLFPVPSCVLFARGDTHPRRLPRTVTRYAGHLPTRDATPAMADRALTATEEAWPSDTGVAASPYAPRSKNGATLWPRRLILVQRLPTRGRLGGNAAAPLVRGRTSKQDKAPWNAIQPLEGPVETQFLRDVYLGESIAPYRILEPTTGIVPWNVNKGLLDSDGAYASGKPLLATWLKEAEELWWRAGQASMTFREQIDYFGKLSAQFPIAPIRVVFAKSGSKPTAAILQSKEGVVDNRLYYLRVKTLAEARYLVAVINAETTRLAAEKWQSEGQFGKRDIDKVIFNLPIPLYDPSLDLHQRLVKASAKAERVAGRVPLKEGQYFTTSRRRIREALVEDGVADDIEALVAALIGVAAPATPVVDGDDAGEDDED